MRIDIGNFYITDYCKDNALHCRFKHQLANDNDFLKYGFYHIEEQLEEPSVKEELLPNHSYLIENKNGELIGYLRLGNLNFIGTINLEYGIHSDFRGDGYSYPLLKNLSEYIVGNMKDVKEIRENISIYNIKSIKTAEKVGYVNNGRKDKDYDYRYSKKSK